MIQGKEQVELKQDQKPFCLRDSELPAGPVHPRYRTSTVIAAFKFAGEVNELHDPATYGLRWVSQTRVAPSAG